MISGIVSPTYEELMLDFLPRPVEREAEYEAIQQEVDRLLDKGELSPDEQGYLDLPGTLIMNYEERTEDKSDCRMNYSLSRKRSLSRRFPPTALFATLGR